jgi:hypothetical protein
MHPFTRAGLVTLILLALAACSGSPKETAAKKEAEKPDEPLTGRQAFQKMFPMARGWARDALPLLMQSYNLSQVKTEKGKAGAWQATFVSTSLGRARPYSWSAIEAGGNLHKGVFAGLEQGWAGPTGQETPFEIAAIRIDSDQAYEAALKHPDAIAYVQKFPDKPVMFLLEKTRRFPDLAWRVVWGESISTSEYSAFIDATTGTFLERTR